MHFATRSSVRPLSRSFKPLLEILEGRALLSAAITIVGHEMDIQADNAGSIISVTDDGSGTMNAWVKTGNQSINQMGHGINKLVIHGGAGNDHAYFQTKGTLLHALELDMDLGAGNDNADLNFDRGISGAPVHLNLGAGMGLDSMDLTFGNIANSEVDVTGNLGHKHDTFHSVLFGGLSGNSVLNYNLQGNGAANLVDLDLRGKIDATAALNVLDQNTPSANDRLKIRYHGELDGVMNVDVDQAAAWYGVQSQFTLDAASTGTLNVKLMDAWYEYDSSLTVTDHSGGPKVSVIDRLAGFLTSPDGTMVSTEGPLPLVQQV